MRSKEDIKKLSEKEADNYFIYKFDELANEKEKMGFTKFAKMCRENAGRIRNKKDLIIKEFLYNVKKSSSLSLRKDYK